MDKLFPKKEDNREMNIFSYIHPGVVHKIFL